MPRRGDRGEEGSILGATLEPAGCRGGGVPGAALPAFPQGRRWGCVGLKLPRGLCPRLSPRPELASPSSRSRSRTGTACGRGLRSEGARPRWERTTENARGIVSPVPGAAGRAVGAAPSASGCRRRSPTLRPGLGRAGAAPREGEPAPGRGRGEARQTGAGTPGTEEGNGEQPGCWERSGPPWRWGCWRPRSPDRPLAGGGRRR